jgi:truncated hemoglobin YjbI
MPAPELCSEQEVRRLVEAFYAKVRADAVLAPIFDSRIPDWERHTARMVAFWCAVLRGGHAYRGVPLAAHAGLPTLTAELFRRWLRMFRETSHPTESAHGPTRRPRRRARRRKPVVQLPPARAGDLPVAGRGRQVAAALCGR